MLSTIVLAVFLSGLLIGSAVLWALFLWLGLRWARVPGITTRRVLLATAIVVVLEIATNAAFCLVSPSSNVRSIVFGLVELAAVVIIPCLVIQKLFSVPLHRAFQAWLPTLLGSVIAIAFAVFAFRPFLYEAFVVPTNAMAPTLVGQHWRGVCSVCGRPNYCSPQDPRYRATDPPRMICENFHVSQATQDNRSVRWADRFLVAKFVAPRRWDLVVFRYPEDPSTLYVKRLVGFPGEELHIEDGSVWIDGKQQTLPESIRGIHYLSELPDWHGAKLWGSVDRPALLGADEYFVLGDFSAQSKDSRLWQEGAPGHHPFAVPKSHLKGVVTHIYWPPRRWRIIR